MLYCKRVVDSVSDASYYLLVSMHIGDGEPEHSSSFDVQVTDGQSAWSQNGTSAFTVCFCLVTIAFWLCSSIDLWLIRQVFGDQLHKLLTGWLLQSRH